MITIGHIKLSNFKCFSKEVDLELGKLTLLTGANSTGKSSLMYSVLGAFQSPRFPYEFSANGRYVNMGNFFEMVFCHDRSLPIEIAFSLIENNRILEINTTWGNSKISEQAELRRLEVHYENFDFVLRPIEEGNDTDFLLNLDYRPSGKLPISDRSRELFLSHIYQVAEQYNSAHPEEEDISKKMIAGYEKRTTVEDVIIRIDEKGISCPDNVQAVVAYGIANHVIQDMIKRYRSQMNFIGSYRSEGKRIYLEESLEDGKIHASGDGFVNEILHWRENNREKYESLVEIMRSMGMLYDIEPKRIEGGQFKVNVKIKKDGPSALLTDVGFGISQLLPVVVGDIELGKGSTLFTAQPEIHLHPNAQANYADYLVSQLDKKNYVIETHSEYLLNRIRLAIVKGALSENDVRIYYMSQEKDATKVSPIQFTKSGKILGAPKGFFETYMLDVMDIAMEAVENEA